MILPRLAVFQGSFSRQAAEQIAGVTLHDISCLVDKSLVRRATNGRFDLHDLLRQYCIGILEQNPIDCQETHHRHSAFYSSRLSGWNELLKGINQGQVLQEIETDLENCKAAWEWAFSHRQLDILEQAMDGLGMFLMRRALLDEGWETYRKVNAVLQDNTMLMRAYCLSGCLQSHSFGRLYFASTWDAVRKPISTCIRLGKC